MDTNVILGKINKDNVDQIKMFRYARRRNREDELVKYIKEHTNMNYHDRCYRKWFLQYHAV